MSWAVCLPIAALDIWFHVAPYMQYADILRYSQRSSKT